MFEIKIGSVSLSIVVKKQKAKYRVLVSSALPTSLRSKSFTHFSKATTYYDSIRENLEQQTKLINRPNLFILIAQPNFETTDSYLSRGGKIIHMSIPGRHSRVRLEVLDPTSKCDRGANNWRLEKEAA